MASNWDHNLPKLALRDVSIQASSLNEAWQIISTEHLARSVLVAPDPALEARPFVYESAICTVKDVYDAVAATYSLDWIQDEQTGVAWFHPETAAHTRILTTKVHVDRDQFGLPMQSGILEPLEDSSAAGINVQRWDTLFQNTFNYALDVPAGVYAIRDLLNVCCLANPSKTFFVQPTDDLVFVTAVNLAADQVSSVPAGALAWWDVRVGQERGNRAPTQEQVMTALAASDPEVRHAARGYLEAIVWSVAADEWVLSDNSATKLLWTCIGITSVLVRSAEATHRASIETMERLATPDFLAQCEPGLAVMTALDLARLTKDERAWEIVARRNFKANELAGIASDACRVAALSGYVRKLLRKELARNLLASLRPLAALVQSFTAGKLEFEFR